MTFVVLLLVSFAAGFLGTVIMTVVQLLEIELTKRPSSYVPALAFAKVFRFDLEKLSEISKDILNYAAHFAFGTFWGFPLAFFIFLGFVNFIPVLILYFLIVWTQGWVVLWALRFAPPIWRWKTRSIFVDGFHHFIYALSTVLFFLFILSMLNG